MKDIRQLKEGDILSETSHYIVKYLRNGSVILKHHEGGTEVALSLDYIQSFTNSADEVYIVLRYSQFASKNKIK